ncbi:MAG: tol-pal system-associated acyl-CoA thioesterase [Pseudomonadota bacterium]
MSKLTKLNITVYYEDTDAAGVVYHANYLKFMERGRTEWLRKLGFEQRLLSIRTGVMFVIHKSTLKFVKPARLDDQLTVNTEVEAVHGASITFKQSVRSSADDLLCEGANQIACVDVESLAPCRIPQELRQAL